MRPIEAPKCARLLDEIELEMKREHVWQAAPLAPDKFIDMGAFGANKMAYEQWLQFVFIPAVREPPKSSQVHIHAVRCFDGQSDRGALVQLLCDFDETYMQEVAAPPARPSSPAASMTEICKAAEQGSAEAQFNVGVMYDNGRGVAEDRKAAVLWYAKAAEQGNAPAQCNLGGSYANGNGVAKDENAALFWVTKAAKQGYARAQFNLGRMYADGQGVTQDIVSAHVWFLLAVRAGYGSAEKHRDLTAAQMTPMQLSRAQNRAQRCINSNYKDFD
jgi:TPR repeat protein